jgi:hypothetical protein
MTERSARDRQPTEEILGEFVINQPRPEIQMRRVFMLPRQPIIGYLPMGLSPQRDR